MLVIYMCSISSIKMDVCCLAGPAYVTHSLLKNHSFAPLWTLSPAYMLVVYKSTPWHTTSLGQSGHHFPLGSEMALQMGI